MEKQMEKAVAAAELIPLLDIKNKEDVKTVAEATEAPLEVVDAVVEAAKDLEKSGDVSEVAVANFSKKVNEVIKNGKYIKNFSESPKTDKEKILNAIEVVELIDKDNLTKETSCIAECIADATGADKEVVEAAVEVAKNFSRTDKKSMKLFTFKAKNFADASTSGAEENIEIVGEKTEPVVAAEPAPAKPTDGVPPVVEEGNVAQTPKDAKQDVEAGDKPNDVTPAVEGMKVSEKMATIADKVDSIDNFSKTEGKTSLLGDYLKDLK